MTTTANVIVSLAGFALGLAQFAHLRSLYPALSVETVHRCTRGPLAAVVVAGSTAAAIGLLNINASVAWSIPVWFDAISDRLLWVIVFLAMSYVMTLGVAIAWRQGHSKRSVLAATSAIVIGSLLFLQFRLGRLPELAPGGELTANGFHLQTTGATCAPASGASIAKVLGIATTEAEMVELMSTSGEGSSVGQIIVGMRKIGIVGKKVLVDTPEHVKPPAMLFVDHEATGPESHAIALVSSTSKDFHLVDPLIGELRLNAVTLQQVWHGKAVEFQAIQTQQ